MRLAVLPMTLSVLLRLQKQSGLIIQYVSKQSPVFAALFVLCWKLNSAASLYAAIAVPAPVGQNVPSGQTVPSETVAGTTSDAQAEPADDAGTTKAFDVSKVDAYLAEPMLKLAEQFAKTGQSEAAEACKNWVPVRRRDALTAYFSSVSAKGPVGVEEDQAKAEAFSKARQETAGRALRGAIRSAENGQGGLALELLWRAVREDPNNQAARKLLGLPPGNTTRSTTRPGRNAPKVLGWPQRSFLVGQSQHFRVYSTASKRETIELTEDLERYFEVWSQYFLRLWTTEEAICRRIAAKQSINLPSVVCEVVLFGDRAAYVRTLGAENPASSQSTGYYSPEHQLTLLFAGEDADIETRYHEMTHQLLQEAVGQVVESPGLNSGFWIIEGIASYMESIQFGESYATVGGWHSPRLQYSRSRILPTQQVEALEEILPLGRDPFQGRDDLAAIYSTSAAYVHMLSEEPQSREQMLRYLQAIYAGRDAAELLMQLFDKRSSDSALVDYLSLESWKGQPLPKPLAPLKVLCLNRAQIDVQQLSALTLQPQLEWLDLGLLPVTSSMLGQLVGVQTNLKRLNLEATAIDDSLGTWLSQQRQLEELDLSFTSITDQTVNNLRGLGKLETLWLSGTKISQQALPALKSLRTLRNLDVQRTTIPQSDLGALRQALPETAINPLQLR